jgi:hypothetical protein
LRPAASIPSKQKAAFTGNEELVREFTIPYCECKDGSLRSCRGGTEPDHGSDNIGMGEAFFYKPNVRTNCLARRDGDGWVITVRKSRGALKTRNLNQRGPRMVRSSYG